MPRSRSALIVASAVFALAASLPAAPSAATQPNDGSRTGVGQPIAWHPCGGRLECGRFDVPLDYDVPGGRRLTLRLVKLPAAEPANRVGTLFVNPGGPGESGVGFVRREARSALPPRVLARLDVVGFDPRGVARSSPLRCFKTGPDENRFWSTVPLVPRTHAEERRVVRASLAYGRRCERRDRDLVAHMTTAEVARDLDGLRAAVGDRRLTFVGHSYGSELGLTYANMFPDRVRAISVDGVIDPVSWAGRGDAARRLPVDVRLKSDVGSNQALHGFLQACAQAPDACSFASDHLRMKFDRLFSVLERRPIHLGSGHGSVTWEQAVNRTLHGLYGWQPATSLAHFLQRLWTHRDSPKTIGAVDRPSRRPARVGRTYPNYYDSSYGVTCGDSTNPHDPWAWARAADRRQRVSPVFGRYWTWLDSVCASLRPGPDRYSGPFDRRTHNPVLFVSTRRDPATRHRDAVDAAARMPGSRLITIDGTGHTSLTQDSQCARHAISAYLIRTTLPPRRLVCDVDSGLFE
jgi:pimeloyl-ACP methyl ester carboxylesterase